METENSLDLSLINLRKFDTDLKSRYLKLTRITKKIQDIVTGREESNKDKLIKDFDEKKKNLEENKNTRIKEQDSKLNKLKLEIDKKRYENELFAKKYEKLKEDVKRKETMVALGKDDEGEGMDMEMVEGKDAKFINKPYFIFIN